MANGANRPGAEMDEQELATRMLQIQSKRFYVDVKQNCRGRFIKIAEVGSGGRKSRILMPIVMVKEFKGRLAMMDAFYKESEFHQTEPSEQPNVNNVLKSDAIYYDSRRYYLDLKENGRGKFLRVTQIVIRASSTRSQVAIPAQGIESLQNTLDELLNLYGKEYLTLPESTRIRVDNKLFFCDVRQNNRGVFMRISEVQREIRSAITIPQKSWIQFRDYFLDVCEEMAKLDSGGKTSPDEGSPISGGNSTELNHSI